jgi:hypothetical protein
MGRILFIALLVAAICTTNNPVAAEGAVALGVPASVVKRGVATGYSYDASTAEEAEKVAMDYCSKAPAPADTRRLCKVVAHFHKQCVAVALDPVAGTPGWGWAIADVKRDAESAALANCEKIAGRGRAAACKVVNSDCDGSAK